MLTDQESVVDQVRLNGDVSSSTWVSNDIDIELDEDNMELDLTGFADDDIERIKEVMLNDKRLKDEELEKNKRIVESTEQMTISMGMMNIDCGENNCSVCNQTFSSCFNRKKICYLCDKGVCDGCLYKFYQSTLFMCKRCFLVCTRDGQTGRWFQSLSKTYGRHRRSAPVIISNSIQNIEAKRLSNPNSERQSLRRQSHEIEVDNGDLKEPTFRSMKNIPVTPRRSYMEVIKKLEDGSDVMDGVEQIKKEVTKAVKDDSVRLQNDTHSNLSSMTSLSTSAMSMFSETEESFKTNIPVSGEIYFAVCYKEGSQSLEIYVDQCRGIAVADRKRRRTDPYIKTYLLPDRTKMSKRKTTIKKMTMTPVFKETLVYSVTKEDLLARTLYVSVWHKSSFLEYNIFLGAVQLALSDVSLEKKDCIWYSFQDKKRCSMKSGVLSKGELQIKLKYKAGTRKDSKGTLHVLVVSAQNIESDHANINAYVKGYLLPDRDQKSKRKTFVCKNSPNPTWNFLLQFPDVTFNELRDRSLELAVCHQYRLQNSEFLGGVRLNLGLGLHSSEHVQWMDAQGAEKEAWEGFLSSPNEYTDVNLNLRANLDF